ncbi:MAG: hypothetical protein BroJett011_03920 [Chloroflexota bacterium]|nr:MAG: hypothetical protein BroJett011_03920 [Chloroflexota bacterium]
MAFGRETTEKNIKPLEGAVIERVTIGATVAAGEILALASDGKYDPADASSITLAWGDRIALEAGADGDRIDTVPLGRVQCLIDATPGTLIYVGATAGEPAESAATKSVIIGMAVSATVLFVRPQIVALT